MKKILLASVMVIATGLSGSLLADNHGKSAERHDRHMQYMSKSLDLTSDQETRIRAINEEHASEYRSLRDKHQADINAVLTPEQQEKMTELREQKREKMSKRWEDGKEKRKQRADGES